MTDKDQEERESQSLMSGPVNPLTWFAGDEPEMPDFPVGGAWGDTPYTALGELDRIVAVLVAYAIYQESPDVVSDDMKQWMIWTLQHDPLVRQAAQTGLTYNGKPPDTRSMFGRWMGGDIVAWDSEITNTVRAMLNPDAVYAVAAERNDADMLALFDLPTGKIERGIDVETGGYKHPYAAALPTPNIHAGYPIVWASAVGQAGAGTALLGTTGKLSGAKALIARIYGVTQRLRISHPKMYDAARAFGILNLGAGVASLGNELIDVTIHPDEYPEFERQVNVALSTPIEQGLISGDSATASLRSELGLPPVDDFNPDATIGDTGQTAEYQEIGGVRYALDEFGGLMRDENGNLVTLDALAYQDDPYVGFPDRNPGAAIYRGQRPANLGPGGTLGDWFSEPTYHISDVEAFLNGMTPTALADFEARAIKAGLIDPDTTVGGMKYVSGTHSNHVINAAYNLFAVTNRSHEQDWNAVLDRMVISNQERIRTNRTKFNWDIYPDPDPATFRQTAREAVERRLGRRIRDWEMDMLVSQQAATDRAAFDAEQQAAFEQYLYDGRMEELEYLGTDTDVSSPVMMQATNKPMGADEGLPLQSTVQQIDPAARFDEFFRDKFGAEEDRAIRTAKVEQATANLMTGLRRAGGAA